jgi:uroporphyrinogen decarboxylase
MVNRQARMAETAPGAGRASPWSYDSLVEDGENLVCIGTLSNLFMICCYLRGMEQFLVDMVSNRPLAERLIGEVGEFCLEFSRREVVSMGSKADIYATWDDVAGQQGLLFSPKLFDRYFLPLYRQLIDNVKRHGLIFSWHCCGSVNQVLPAMIDAGLDVFDVVQTSARGMDLENVRRLYGKSVCLHGAIDVQRLLVFGTPAEVRDEVKRVIDLWGLDGGIIVAPSHLAVAGTPIENILAIYEQIGALPTA